MAIYKDDNGHADIIGITGDSHLSRTHNIENRAENETSN